MTLVKNLSVGREIPVERQANPVSNNERRTILEAISGENPGASLEFWETWLNEAGLLDNNVKEIFCSDLIDAKAGHCQ